MRPTVITGTYVTEVLREDRGSRVWDHAPSRIWEKVINPPEGEVLRCDWHPMYHAYGRLRGIEFLLAPAPMPCAPPPKRAKLSVMGAWLQAKDPPPPRGNQSRSYRPFFFAHTGVAK